jgi:predicted nucleic acid-binding protein
LLPIKSTKTLLRGRGKELAEIFLSQAFGFHDRVIQLDLELSLLAARTSLETHLPRADAIIYATGHHHKANLVTSDTHFANLPGVKLISIATPPALTHSRPAYTLVN